MQGMDNTSWVILGIIMCIVIAFITSIHYIYGISKGLLKDNSRLMSIIENQKKTQEEQLEQKKTQDEVLSFLQQQTKEQQEALEALKKKLVTKDETIMLEEKAFHLRQDINDTAEMNDDELMEWVNKRLDNSLLYKDPNLSLKQIAQQLNLTQKRLIQLIKKQDKYNGINDYLTEKRFLLGCKLLQEKTNWTIEAVSKEAGFMSTRTFQVEVKKRLGITPSQFRQNNNPKFTQNVNDTQQELEYPPKKRGRKPKINSLSDE